MEFYHSTLDHYFISALPADIQAPDSGKFPGWARTGLGFKAYDAPTSGASPVRRFYIPPAAGDSHFHSASPGECADMRTRFPSFTCESPAVMYAGLPDAATGACHAGWIPVYRLWNQRADTNHRYTTDIAVRAAMLGKGYAAEGYGPDGVAICAPVASNPFDISLAPANVLLTPGESRTVYVTVTPHDGFAGAVALAAAGFTEGVSHQFAASAVSVGPGSVSTTVRVTASGSAAPTNAALVSLSGSETGGAEASAALGVGVAAAGDPIAVRLRAPAAVEERGLELRRQGLSRDAYLAAIAAYMATRTEYAESGVDQETRSAWGRFKDGHLHIIAANRAPTPSAARALQPGIVAKQGAEVPYATRASLLHTFGRNFEGQTPIDQMRGYLTSKGWTVGGGPEGEGGVETLKGVQNEGFVYLNAHAGRGPPSFPTEPESKFYSVQSSTLVDANNEKAHDEDLKELRLVHFQAPYGDVIRNPDGTETYVEDNRYAITHRFVEKYMSFPPGSVVFMNACFSSRNALFINAFLNKGAGVYIGWSESVSAAGAYAAPPYFVDRMVGANMHPTKESPPQRAFSYDLVLADMAKKGLDTDGGGKLQAIANMGNPPILAPSIQHVQVDEFSETITLVGLFGQERPIVTVGAAEVQVVSWSGDEIVARLTLKGPGSSGDVVVAILGVRSNARQLTEWAIPLTYLWDGAFYPEHKFNGFGTFRLRADVAAYRLMPAAVPEYIARGGWPTKDSNFTITASGVHPVMGCSFTLSGTAVFPSYPGTGGVPPANFLFTPFEIAGDTGSLTLGFLLGGSKNFKETSSCGGGEQQIDPDAGLLDGIGVVPLYPIDRPTVAEHPMKVTLDYNFGMPATSKPCSVLTGLIRMSWPAVPAQTPPRDTVDAGK